MTTYSIQEFTSFVKSDGLGRQNRFAIQMDLPTNIKISGKMIDYELLCRSVSVGGVNVATQQYRTTGEMTNVPYDRTFSGATFTFVADQNMIVRDIFERWVDLIQDKKSRILGYYNDIARDITVMVLNRMNNHVYSITLHEAFPKTIGDLSVDNASNDLMTIPITFEYKYYSTHVNDVQGYPTNKYLAPNAEYTTDGDPALTSGSLSFRGGLEQLFNTAGRTFLTLPGMGVLNNIGASAANLGPVGQILNQATGIATRQAQQIFQSTSTTILKDATTKVFPNLRSINLKL